MNENEALLEVKGLKKYFPIKSNFWRRVIGHVRAVDGVDLFVRQGETLGLVGESGCGKTTLGRCILRAIEPSAGQIFYHLRDQAPVDFLTVRGEQMQALRPHMQMVFQDPFSALDPRMTVYDIISEPLWANPQTVTGEVVARVRELMGVVGLDARYMRRYPHAFSTGQRQRISVARALATNPEFIVCDEPVSALDVSVRSQILNLLLDLQDQFQVSYLFISHDLSVIHPSHLAPGRRDVRGQGRGDGGHGGALRAPEASLHRGAAARHPAARSPLDAHAPLPVGRTAEPRQPALGLLLPPALPLCQRGLRDHGARLDRKRAWSLCRLPLRRRVEPGRDCHVDQLIMSICRRRLLLIPMK